MVRWILLCLIVAAHGNAVVEERSDVEFLDVRDTKLGAGAVPMVIAKGMGDACLNPGMTQITKLTEEKLGVYATCIPDGDSQPEDTVNGFLLNMNELVDNFAVRVRKDPHLKNGFNAMGFSQGNLVIRGYVEKYNDPPVKRFLSVHGPMAGVGSLPRCSPDGLVGILCRKVTDIVGDVAYSKEVQEHIAQANYLKDPEEMDLYLKGNIFLPFLNNEVEHPDSAKFKKNFESLEKLVLVRAEKDTMIFPSQSEWFGYFGEGGFQTILPFNQTKAYTQNSFGLKTLVEQGKVEFLSTAGNHLQFSLKELNHWLEMYMTM